MLIVKMSIAASFFMLVVIGLRLLLVNRLPKITFIALWWSVIIKLLIPLELPNEYKAALKIQSIQRLLPKEIIATNVSDKFDVTIYSQVVSFLKGLINNQFLPYIIWTGTILISAFFIISLIRHFSVFSNAQNLNCHHLEHRLKRENFRRKISIKTSIDVASPLTYGINFPVIIIPEAIVKTYSEEELYLVLMHEMTHIKHFDQLTKLALVVTVCLHWFNPLVWLMLNLANRDIELACDESVIKRVGSKHKNLYSVILLNQVKKGLASMCVENYFAKCFIEKRLIAINKIKAAKLREVAFAYIIVFAVVGGMVVSNNFAIIDDIQDGENNTVLPMNSLNSVISVEVFANKDDLFFNVNHNNVNYGVRGSTEQQLLRIGDDLEFNVTYSNVKETSSGLDGDTHLIVFEKK